MSASYEKLVEALRRSVAENTALKGRNRQLAAAAHEPVAIVGMACRLPGGVAGPEDLWRLVSEGRDAVSGFPVDRGWDLDGLFDPDPEKTGTSYVEQGGFLHEAGLFDPGFFGISPREALAMDPQQRLLLEVSWEALERAGVDPASLRGTDVGVFSGIMGVDYFAGGVVPPELEGFTGTGAASSVASGRVSYVFGFEGPAVTVDTACSSSLVTIHLAAEALRRGECSMALAGGATVMATPGLFIDFSRQRGLATDGRCKAFSSSADGTGWAEGAGVVVLERLSVARERGHRVLAVVRGSAVNQDGASNGLTAPNGPAQQRVIRKALASAGLTVTDVDVVEGHGTGTVLGDPIEAQALLETYGQGRDPERPLWLGSLKSNLGHTQAAAGVAGVIKMVQALRHGVLPPTLHVDEPSGQVDWSVGGVRLLTEARVWPDTGRARRAGVSGFGVSGTNAHVILEQVPEQETRESPGNAVVPLVISARTERALAGAAERLSGFLRGGDVSLAGVASGLVSGRGVLGERAVVVAGSAEEAVAGLDSLALGGSGAGVARGSAGGGGKVVFVFPGQGAQRVGMGRELYGRFPVFAQALDEVCGLLDGVLGGWVGHRVWDVVLGEVSAGSDSSLLDQTVFAQTSLFAVEVALVRLLGSWGVRPDAVVGHSIGELVGAWVAGVLSLEDAVRVVGHRGRLMQGLAPGGAMVAVGLSEAEVSEFLGAGVEVAAVNGPSSVVLSGEEKELLDVVERLRDREVKTKRLSVSHAFHSARMELMLDEFAAELAKVTLHEPTMALLSNVTGKVATPGLVTDAGYWVEHVRRPVRFADDVAAAVELGGTLFVEVGPGAGLSSLVDEVAGSTCTAVLRDGRSEAQTLLTSVGELFVRGVDVDWAQTLPSGAAAEAAPMTLPTYAFDHQHYWLPSAKSTDAASLGQASAGHPLLSAVVQVPETGGVLCTSRLSLRTHPWLADHAIHGTVLVPGTGLVELAVRAGDEVGCGALEELVIEAPLVVPESGGVRVQVAVGGPGEHGSRSVNVYSLREDVTADDDRSGWIRHATGTLTGEPAPAPAAFDFAAWPPPGARSVDIAGGYEVLAQGGYGYGPAFQCVRSVWHRGGEVFADVSVPPDHRDEAGRFGIHPALLDAALHSAMVEAAARLGAEPGAPDAIGSGSGDDEPVVRLPFAWNGLVLHAAGASALRVRVVQTGSDTLSLEAADESGRPVLTLTTLVSRAVSAEHLEVAARPVGSDSLYQVDWAELTAAAAQSAPVPTWTSVADAAGVAALGQGEQIPAFVVMQAAAAPGDDLGSGDAALALSVRVLEVVQAWLAVSGAEESRLVVVTRGAVPAGEGRAVDDCAGAAVWGLVRAAQAEEPDRIILLDLPADVPVDAAVLAAVHATGEPQVASRGSVLSAPRLARATVADPAAKPVVFDPDGTVLITGGTGSLGALLARHLVVRHNVRHLILVGRRGPDAEGARELVDELTGLGATVSAVACDVSDRAAVAALLAAATAERRLSAVVHAAGIFDGGVVGEIGAERLARVFGPKATAAGHLDELTRDLDLDAFVLFSSVSGVFLGAGTAGYAAANAFLDGVAARRAAAGRPGKSLAWGTWEQSSGMGGDADELGRSRMSRRGGVLALAPAQGLALFDTALRTGRSLLVPARLDLRALRADAAGGAVPPLLRGLVRAGRQQARPASGGPADRLLSGRLAGLSAAEQAKALLDLVREHVASVLGHRGPEAVDAQTAFKDAGFDSLTSVELRNRLRAATGLKLSATVVFDYPSPAALARYLHDELDLEGGAAGVPAAPTAVRPVDPDDPIAIVGMACHLPGGVSGPDELWRLVAEGRDAVSGFPADRGWDLDGLFDADPQKAGTSYVDQGGFLHRAGLFDAEFFGISPREAVAMDPQQRLLLETSWEALEAAGIDPTSLKGTDVGVFNGIMGVDYYSGGAVPEEVGGFGLTGAGASVASGRVSYVFGFEGPAVSVDTACSSSLVAIHLAAQALRQGECSLALAGGATVMSSPSMFMEFSRQGALASDGRCKSYAQSADGTGWAEGVGVVVLERLSAAREHGHRVLAVVRGSAVNQDGASNGLTAPNGPSQQRVIRKALASAGLDPADVDAVEGHGTGTTLGDPIEAQALLATYGRDRDPQRPLWLGSLKSNIGHAQAAAGVAGVIKMVQALRRGVLPATLHVDEPSGEVDWSAGGVQLLTRARPWPQTDRPRRAAVSSFGLSGTNAHVILEQVPQEASQEPDDDGAVLPLVVSARSSASLAGAARRLAGVAGGVPTAGVAGALLTGRAVLGERAVVLAGSREQAVLGFEALASGAGAANVVTGSAGTPGKTVWVFPGQGAQWAGMGRELLDASPVFAERIAECERVLAPWADWSLVDVLRGEADAALLERVDVVQPASFAVMVGLAAVWAAAGVLPDAVLGHSQGEIAAACVGGALSLEDAMRVVAVRSQAVAAALAGRGAMASVALPEAEAARRVARWADRIQVAVVNGPSSVVLSGDGDALDEALAELSAEGVRVRRVAVDYASHSSQAESVEGVLAGALAGIRAQAPVVPFLSTVTNEWIQEADVLDGGYWYRNLRQQVRFGPAVADLIDQGFGVFVEVSTHPVLVQPISEIIDARQAEAFAVGTLRRDDGGLRRLLTSMAELFVRGVPVDWARFLPAEAAARVDLPTYAFDHRHYWLRRTHAVTDAASLGLAGADHPLLGAVVDIPETGGVLCTARLSLRSHPWLADHAVEGVVLLPGTGLVELAIRAGDEVGCGVLDELVIEAPLIVPRTGGVRVHVAVGGPDETGRRTVTVHSTREDAADGADRTGWARHAAGTLAAAPAAPAPDEESAYDFTAWPPPDAERVDVDADDFYGRLLQYGYEYGPAFRGVRAVWRVGEAVFAEVCLPGEQQEQAARFGLHPALLDAALHAKAFLAGSGDRTVLPFAWTGLELHAAGASALRIRVAPSGPDAISLQAADQSGGRVLSTRSLVFRPVSAAQLGAAAGRADADSLFQVEWTEPARTAAPAGQPAWVWVSSSEQVATLAEDTPADGDWPQLAVLDATAHDPDAPSSALAAHVLEIVQTWSAGSGFDRTRLVVATRGAVPAGGDRTVTDPAASAVWGLVRAAQAENPGQMILLDLDPADADPVDSALLGVLSASGEPQVAVRGGTLTVPRLRPLRTDDPAQGPADLAPAVFDPDGTVLITGGTGSLGRLLAGHLASRHGVRHLVLASRRGPDADGAAEAAAELAALGATVSIVACDVSDRAAVTDLVGSIVAERRLSAVVHAAGVFDAGVLAEADPDRLDRVFASKATAARHLDEATRDLAPDLDAFIVFSSVAGVFLGAGTGAYAAANAYLDGLVARRRAAGRPGQSLAWGAWQQTSGMAAGADELRLSRLNRRGGVLALTPAQGLDLFDAAVRTGPSLVVAARLDLRALRADAAAGNAVPPLLRGLVRTARAAARTAPAGDERRLLAERLAALPAAEQPRALLDLVRTQIALVLGYSASYHIDPGQGLFEIGFDSLTAIELRNRLGALTGLALAPGLVFDHPTPGTLAEHVFELMYGGPDRAAVSV